MRYFLDAEFDEDGRTIELISIALVREDYTWCYYVSSQFDPARCNDWVREHVLPNLWSGVPEPHETHTTRDIADLLRHFVGDDPQPVFWGYCADYDWVALCQLYGPMVAKPASFPFYCRDLRQLADEIGVDLSSVVSQTNQHNALSDADWNRRAYLWLSNPANARIVGRV
jgi:3'-5' exoribonuclease Rv2179c-like domain